MLLIQAFEEKLSIFPSALVQFQLLYLLMYLPHLYFYVTLSQLTLLQLEAGIAHETFTWLSSVTKNQVSQGSECLSAKSEMLEQSTICLDWQNGTEWCWPQPVFMVQLGICQGIWYWKGLRKERLQLLKGWKTYIQLTELKLSIHVPHQPRQLQAVSIETYRDQLQ